MSQIVNGSVVTLRSGGPLMTVLNVVARGPGEATVICVWFDQNGSYKSEQFSPHLLKFIE